MAQRAKPAARRAEKRPQRAKARGPDVKKRAKPAVGRAEKRPRRKAREARPTSGLIPVADAPTQPASAPAPVPVAAAGDTRPDSVLSGGFGALLLGALAFSVVLLAVSSVPPWTVNNLRTATLLGRWRGPLAAVGISTLFAVGLVLALDAWSP